MPSPVDPTAQREFAVKAVEALRAAGFEAYWAGGCVRDLLLGGQPKDYDVATSARPREVQRVFRGYHTVSVGASFGVIIVVGPRGAGQLDVATFRSDDSYSDGRRPDSVTFSDAQEDVKRRDFSINGILFDPIESKVIDYVGGQKDIQARQIRAIGQPAERITEDKLRMLRAVRFASRLGFEIESETQAAIESMADQITVVSAERITEELRAMLVHANRCRAVLLCRDVGLLRPVLPEAFDAADQPGQDVSRSAGILDRLESPDLPLALAVLLRSYAAGVDDRQRGKKLLAIGRRLRLSTTEMQAMDWLVRHADLLHGAREAPWSRIQRILIDPRAGDLIDLHRAVNEVDHSGKELDDSSVEEDLKFCEARFAWPADKLNPPALVTGDDLISAGIPRGGHYRVILDAVRDAQLDKEIDTRGQGMAMALEMWERLKKN